MCLQLLFYVLYNYVLV